MSTTVKRVIACILDVLLMGMISLALSISPLNPNANKVQELEAGYKEEMEDWSERATGVDESSSEALELIKEYRTLNENFIYDGAKLSIYENLITIIVSIVYFIIVPFFMDGSTLGKKIMKLKISKVGGEPVSFGWVFIREMLLYGIVFNIVDIIAMYVLNKNTFISFYVLSSYASYILGIAVIVTTLFRQDRRGLHDLIAGTIVEERK